MLRLRTPTFAGGPRRVRGRTLERDCSHESRLRSIGAPPFSGLVTCVTAAASLESCVASAYTLQLGSTRVHYRYNCALCATRYS